MTLTEAPKWAAWNCTPEATERLRSRRVVATLVAEVKKLKLATELYEQALQAAFPQGATGKTFDCWNEARKLRSEE